VYTTIHFLYFYFYIYNIKRYREKEIGGEREKEIERSR